MMKTREDFVALRGWTRRPKKVSDLLAAYDELCGEHEALLKAYEEAIRDLQEAKRR